MEIMTRITLRKYVDQPRNAAAKGPMLTWAATVRQQAWRNFAEVKQTFPAADLLLDDRVCFDVGGNKWRIIADVRYARQTVFLVWIGSHADYDRL